MRACTRTDPHTCPSHQPVPACRHCGAPDVIRGDGGMTLTCARCVAALARIAGDPLSASMSVVARLEDASLDVLRLSAGAAWSWTASWPATGDLRTLTGRPA